jgi:Protein of unknown function (DUF1257)
MSHFSQIKTQIRSLGTLQSALTDLGMNWKIGPEPVAGYQGQSRMAELVIEQANGYGVGFCWNGTEYELVADLQFWQQPWPIDRFLSKVTQRYAYNTVVNASVAQGFQVSEQTQGVDGSVRLVVQRWSA